MSNIISSHIGVSPNEYVTKFAYNRNFNKLVINDETLLNQALGSTAVVQTYNKNKEYAVGDYVFFKFTPDDEQLYLLSSKVKANTHMPLAKKTSTGELNIINGDYWGIVGIPPDALNRTPRDIALDYIATNKASWEETHQENAEVHPSGKLGLSESTKAYTSLLNLTDDRENLYFPYHIESIGGNGCIQSGYLKKWDNGLLEYDFDYRLGYRGQDGDGRDVIKANDLEITYRTSMQNYFKTESDYEIFKKTCNGIVNNTTSKQINVDPGRINSYSGVIRFPEEFKDTNYMIFGTNVKNVDTQSHNTKNNTSIQGYDERLVLDGLKLSAYVEGSSFRFPLPIPNEVVNIGQYALAESYETNKYPVVINICADAGLVNIDSYAFQGSHLRTVNIPYRTRYIGPYAFSNCSKLTCIDIYAENDPSEQVKIAENAFSGSPVSIIRIHTRPTALFASAYEQDRETAFSNAIPLWDKLKQSEMKAWYGLPQDVIIYKDGEELFTVSLVQAIPEPLETVTLPVLAQTSMLGTSDASDTSTGGQTSVTVDLQTFLKSLESGELPPVLIPKFAAAPAVLAAGASAGTKDLIKMSGNTVTGYDNSALGPNDKVHIDLGDSSLPAQVKSIASGALAGFQQISSLVLPNTLTSIGDSAFTDVDVVKMAWNLTANVDAGGNKFYGFHCDSLSILNSRSAFYPSKFNIAAGDAYVYNTTAVQCQNASFAGSYDSLSIINVQSIMDGCFNSATIGSLTIQASSSGIVCQKNSFVNCKKVKINGSKVSLETSAFSGCPATQLVLDMASSKIYADAFAESDMQILRFNNFQQGQTSQPTVLSGLCRNCLCGSYISQLYFNDVNNVSAISNIIYYSSTVQNYIGAPFGATLNAKNDQCWVKDGGVMELPNYLKFSGTTLTDCDWENAVGVDDCIIPDMCTKIKDSALCPDRAGRQDEDQFFRIFVPKAVTQFGASCFKGLSALEYLDIESSSQLTSIGSNCFTGCSSLMTLNFE